MNRTKPNTLSVRLIQESELRFPSVLEKMLIELDLLKQCVKLEEASLTKQQ